MEVDWGSNYVLRHKNFNDACYILEIGGGDFSRSIALAERYPEKTFFSVDFFYSQKAIENVAAYAHLANLNIIKGNASDRVFADIIFDFAFSIDVGEHIANLKEFIAELSRILKNGGHYFFIQNPFWTSQKGHHYKHWVPEIQEILAGYKHIIFNKQEMAGYLQKYKSIQFDIAECIARIYDRPDLSRLSVSETKKIFDESTLRIKEWVNLHDDTFDKDSALLAISRTANRYELSDFTVKAAIVTCFK